MRQAGGFCFKINDETRKNDFFNEILGFLDTAKFESDNFWAEYLDENLEVDYETFIDYEDYNGLSEPLFISLCKEVAKNLPDVTFDAVSHYCNESAGFNEDFIVNYDGQILTVYRLEYLDGDDYESMQCPDCGGGIYVELWDGYLSNIIPTEVFCSMCNKSFPLKDVAEITEFEI